MAAVQDRLSLHAKRSIIASLTVVVMLVMTFGAEVAVRARQTMRYGTQATVEQLYAVDPQLKLRVPIANLKSGHIETNSLGFRGPEIAVPKPADTLRLAFLGASTTWCGEVSGNEKVWPHLVAEQLREAHPERPIDYVNAGVPGYVVNASLLNFTSRVAPLSPDIVVIYHATNDMWAELRTVAAAKGVIATARFEETSWLENHSLLWNLALKNLRIWLAQRHAEANIGRLEIDAKTLGELFRRDLTQLVQASMQHSQRVAIATFATQLRADQTPEQQIRASASALFYMPFMTPHGLIDSYRRYNQIIREVAAATGSLLIDGENEIGGDGVNFADSVHFTDAGSAAMAVRVTRALLADPAVRTLLTR